MQNQEKKNKHMTLDDRIELQECLSRGMTFKAIAARVGKSPTTISREVKIHMETHINSFVKLDGVCPKLLKAPFVCNGCELRSRSSCRYRRQLYSAKKAQGEYETVLVEFRTGILLNKESFYEIERIISDGVQKGQHIYHIVKSNSLPISIATVYRHIQKRYYRISPIDLPRAVKFKLRNTHKDAYVPKAAREGRSYSDFLAFAEDNRELPIVQLDTVIGRPGGKVIMTIHFVNSDFTTRLLLDNKTAAEAASKFQNLKASLKASEFCFGNIAPLLLTDNGSEFSMVSVYENDIDDLVNQIV